MTRFFARVTAARPERSMPTRTHRIAALLAALALGLAAGAADAQGQAQRITPNFKDADITQVIEAVAVSVQPKRVLTTRVAV